MHHATHIKMPSSHERNGLQQSMQREDPVGIRGERERKNAYVSLFDPNPPVSAPKGGERREREEGERGNRMPAAAAL